MKHVTIIAEAGVNHNGDVKLAKKMVDVAKEAGVDYIKFQTFKPEKLASRFADKAEYQKANTGTDESQVEMLKKLTLSENEYVELADYAKSVGIGFISTPFENDSLFFLKKIDMDFWKLPSGEITNYPFLIEIAKTQMPVVMSTGMSDMEEIREAINVLRENGVSDISLMHCNTQYPTPFEDVNLLVMNTLRREFNVEVGYSDHTKGIEVPIAAVAMGASIIEKHFTLDKNMEGPDHKASLEPDELVAMVRAIRNIELSLGIDEKKVTKSEFANRDVARKSIVARCDIKKGEFFSEDNITTKRPGIGLSPMKWNMLLGKVANRDYLEDELIDSFL